MSKAIEPRLPSGFMDVGPALASARQRMIATIEAQYRLMGSQPLVTPAVEYEDVLIGGEDFSKQLYHVVRRGRSGGEEEEKHPLALRFDLTVPLARYVASHPELSMPFIRHQVGQVWRGERAQQGRYHEFTQFDLDIVGTSSLASDAQVMATMYRVMTQLVGDRFEIRYSHRGLLNGLLENVPLAARVKVLRVLDKMDKMSTDSIYKELLGGGLVNEQAQPILEVITKARKPEDFTAHTGLVGTEAIHDLQQLSGFIDALGILDKQVKFSATIIRGLDYYTGPVWETVLLDAPEFGSVYSGGRYDNLLERFGNRKLPATGTSIGVDRLFAALQKIGTMKESSPSAKVLIARFEDELVPEQLKLAAELRAAGIATELYLGKEKGLTQQIGYAQARGIPVVLLYGAEEQKSGTVQLKVLGKSKGEGKQISIERRSLIKEIKNNL